MWFLRVVDETVNWEERLTVRFGNLVVRFVGLVVWTIRLVVQTVPLSMLGVG